MSEEGAEQASGQESPQADADHTRKAAAVLGALVLVIAGYLVYESTGSGGHAPQPVTGELPKDPSPLAEPSDGGEVELLEQGFSEIADGQDSPLFTWGATVENTSETLAARVSLQGTPLDGDGEPLLSEEYSIGSQVLVMPGEVFGTGHTAYLDDPGLEDVDVQATDVEWWPLYVPGVFASEATDVTVWEDDGDTAPDWDLDAVSDEEFGDDTAFVQFQLESDGYVAHPQASAVFRNSDDDIVGGTDTDLDAFAEVPPGWSVQRIRVSYGPPEDADPERTEVYVHE